MSLPSSTFLVRWLTLASIAIFILNPNAFAQTFRGGIHGTVEDPSGGVLPNAEVKAEHDGTGQVYSTITTSAGEFTFQDLPLGSYTVSASLKGFDVLSVSQVTVRAGSIYNLPLKLAVASVSTHVEVAAQLSF